MVQNTKSSLTIKWSIDANLLVVVHAKSQNRWKKHLTQQLHQSSEGVMHKNSYHGCIKPPYICNARYEKENV